MIGNRSKRATDAPAGNSTRTTAPPAKPESTAIRNAARPKASALVESKARPRTPAEPTHDEIAARAYQLWCERGGNEIVNWLEAEEELKQAAQR